ncbi:serine hydrolase [Ginsengibacter hankyongi]|uniref:Serine hydrolase n=1 Tax=Ginsengibacter hankyongi TaxID=2607284 RepID=A0A5J5IIZ2_9BACT|nr:serine hydrolase [Ginsengibacter hankyongi]KAA9039583.1 serine hydrolase [Ginsengibacter hankyongi]
MKKIILRLLLLFMLLALAWVIHYAWISFPIISGYNAKQMCTCVFVSGRDPKDIDTSDLGELPLNIASNKVNYQDSSVTSSVWGMATKKAIYRRGCGCTLINDMSEKQLRSQSFKIPAPPSQNTDSIEWPYGDKIADTFPIALNKNKLSAAVDNAFKEPNPKRKQRTRAVIILYDGQLIAEKYAPGFNKDTKMYGWSMAKSFTAALIGTLVQNGKLTIDEPAPVPEWKDPNDPRHAITIKNLLQQTSGLDFKEDYTKASDVTNMLYKKDDMAAYAASHSLAHKPGTSFYYSSGNSNILSRIIRQTVGEKEYPAFPFKELFYRIGMYHTLFEPDASGSYVGSSYINATARDYARFGLLYYNDGVWNGERILPVGWVKQTQTSSQANPYKNYGFQFWLNGFDEKHPSQRAFPDVPVDMYYCDGYGYQFVYIIPSKKLVVVRLGLTFDHSFNENAFLKSIIDCIQQ